MLIRLWLTLPLLICSQPSSGLSQDFTGQVAGIMDGDTIEILHNKKTIRVRLQGIDCPEKAQAVGNRGKNASSDLVFAKTVIIKTRGQNKYNRSLADIFLPDGTPVNRELVARTDAGGARRSQ